jgi:hypothetical protein
MYIKSPFIPLPLRNPNHPHTTKFFLASPIRSSAPPPTLSPREQVPADSSVQFLAASLMTDTDGTKLGCRGPVEIDETFVGGKVKNLHKAKRIKGMNYSAGNGKTIVLGMLERGGKVRAGVIEKVVSNILCKRLGYSWFLVSRAAVGSDLPRAARIG